MKIKQPQPFTFEAGPRAVLLLHGFTGHSADVRMLGRFLEKKGYTTHAPIYRGHGKSPEELIKTTPEQWWEDVQQAYQHLKDLGYDEVAVAGLSFGGVLGLKLAYNYHIKAVIPMSTPMFFDNQSQLTGGFKEFFGEYKRFIGEDEASIESEFSDLMEDSLNLFNRIGDFVKDVNRIIDMIYAPTFVIQPRLDEMINTESAAYIYEHIGSLIKEMKWYEESTHVITLGKEKNQLHEDIFNFLESLDWKV